MKRSQLNPMPEYFDRYINKCDDVTITEAIQTSIDELDRFPIDKWKALGDRVYAPGKWTVKDILQHLIDTERIFTYRALAFARGEAEKLPPYDENSYAAHADTGSRTLEDLVEELRLVHLSFLSMFASFNEEALARIGRSFTGTYSTASIGYCMPGHQRWHMEILEERYAPLLGQSVVS
jgi:hypothetical protein